MASFITQTASVSGRVSKKWWKWWELYEDEPKCSCMSSPLHSMKIFKVLSMFRCGFAEKFAHMKSYWTKNLKSSATLDPEVQQDRVT